MGRMERINQLIRQEVGIIIQMEMQDPRLSFVTITSASVSPDLHNARINFSVLGDSRKIFEAEQALNNASGYIRKMVSSRLDLKYTPEIEFAYDPSIEYGVRIEKTIKEINEDKPIESAGGNAE